MPCFLSVIQSPIQAFLRPAVWIPGLNRLHSHREKWVAMSGTADEFIDELIQAVDRVAESDSKTTYAVKQVDREKHKVQIYNWTWAEWLDVVEIEFRDGIAGGVEAKCFSFSSGFLPTWFPLCFLFNVVLFWIPFYDNKFNSTRLERLRVSMATECILVPKKNEEPNETTPIVSDKFTPTTSPPRQSSASFTEATDTRHNTMATEHSQEKTTPTNKDQAPAADTVVVVPSVEVLDPDPSDGIPTGTVVNDTSTTIEGAPSDGDAHQTSPSVSNTEPVNT
ncbi:uncharacterized protein LOC129254969 [Lytechinus pictus]|uniref:uncharacterized protein LOC129254969 n=1 Tax=Lytechinus pictus TaxID=7653 RepID=UPI0030B9B3A6